MSNQNKLNWLVLILLLSCVWWLVFVDMARGDTIHHFDTKNDSSVSYVDYNGIRLQPTKQVQKTQSASALHKLSNGVEILPIEMLRSGLLYEYKGLKCVYNCEYFYEVTR